MVHWSVCVWENIGHIVCLKSKVLYILTLMSVIQYGETEGATGMPIYSQEDLRLVLTPIFRQYGVRSATLFGSYAKGCATGKSDVGLPVDSGLRGLAFFGLPDSVASVLQTPVDLIDVSQLQIGSPVEREIRNSGVRIYEQ